jgi:hypothetical protein
MIDKGNWGKNMKKGKEKKKKRKKEKRKREEKWKYRYKTIFSPACVGVTNLIHVSRGVQVRRDKDCIYKIDIDP